MIKNNLGFSDEVKNLSILEKGAMLQIILVLNRNGELLTSKIQKHIDVSNETYYKARKRLEKLKLIEKKKYDFSQFEPYILTDKGKKIGKYLVEISKLLA